MTVGQLRRAWERQPFEPFYLRLADGRAVPVPHRDFLYIPPRSERTFAVSDDHGVLEVIDLLLVVSIRPMSHRESPRRRKAG